MHSPIVKSLQLALQSNLAQSFSGDQNYCVAFSGGLDSTVLLHALVSTVGAEHLRAIHVDHGLHPDSGKWAESCQRVCDDLRVELTVSKLNLDSVQGESLEAAARDARYKVLRSECLQGEAVVTAHHQRDQTETVLIALLRGAGPAGLAAMPVSSTRFGMTLHRPFLDIPANELRKYAETLNLRWTDDSSNSDMRFDRNFLRHEVVPLLAQRWPGLDAVVSRAARLNAESAELLAELAAIDLDGALIDNRLPVARLANLSLARQRNVLRYVIRKLKLSVPSEVQLNQGMQALLHARRDGQPVASWPGARVRRFQEVLWFFSEVEDPGSLQADSAQLIWNPAEDLQFGGVRGKLSLRVSTGAGFLLNPDAQLVVRFRRGGERLRPDHGARLRSLKNLLQENHIVPWMREHIPLVYSGSQLVAVGDLWINADCAASPDQPSGQLVWTDHASIR